MSEPDAKAVAKRLGLTEAVIRRLQAGGMLQRLAVPDTVVRERLYNAQLAFMLRGAWRREPGPGSAGNQVRLARTSNLVAAEGGHRVRVPLEPCPGDCPRGTAGRVTKHGSV